jgi:hypothetical protein
MEIIPVQLESCSYDVCVQKHLKFGMIKGVQSGLSGKISFYNFPIFQAASK